MTPSQRSLYGRIGAAVARSRHTPAELTAAARSTFLSRFEREIREEFPGLPPAEVERRAKERRRAYMLALSAKSSQARSKKKGATRAKAAPQEVRRGCVTTPPPRAA